MTSSEKRTAANRRNAQRSTGPRTEIGKQRSRRNAVRHGLFSRLRVPCALDLDEQYFVRLFTEAGPAGASLGLVEDLARAQLYVLRIRDTQSLLLEEVGFLAAASGYSDPAKGDVEGVPLSQFHDVLTGLERLTGYEVRAMTRRERLIRQWCVMVEECGRTTTVAACHSLAARVAH